MTKTTLGGKLMFPSQYISAVEFKGSDVTLTIASVKFEQLRRQGGGKELKPILRFERTQKALVLNKTNASSIADMYGTAAEDWIGKTVTFYPTRTRCGANVVDCIRVREGKRLQPSNDPQFAEPLAEEIEAAMEEPSDSPFNQESDPQSPDPAAQVHAELSGDGAEDQSTFVVLNGIRWAKTLSDMARKSDQFVNDAIASLKPDTMSSNRAARDYFHGLHKPHSWSKIPASVQDSLWAGLLDGTVWQTEPVTA